MAAIVWTDVTALAPELASVTSTSQTDILAYVNQALAVAFYGGETSPSLRLARILLAAHFASIVRIGSGGQLIGESAGGLSRQYAPTMSKSQLALTAYGQQFLALLPPAVRGPQVL